MFPKKGNELHRLVQSSGSNVRLGPTIAAALKAELGSTHQAVKTVLRWTGASERTVKHWFAGTHSPSGEHLVALMRNSDAIMIAVLRMADREPAIIGIKILAVRDKLLEVVDWIDGQDQNTRV
jgi:hypothetical protein